MSERIFLLTIGCQWSVLRYIEENAENAGEEQIYASQIIHSLEIRTFRYGTYASACQNLPPRIILGKDGALNIPTMSQIPLEGTNF